jgi:hypothetical protein
VLTTSQGLTAQQDYHENKRIEKHKLSLLSIKVSFFILHSSQSSPSPSNWQQRGKKRKIQTVVTCCCWAKRNSAARSPGRRGDERRVPLALLLGHTDGLAAPAGSLGVLASDAEAAIKSGEGRNTQRDG